MSIKTDRELSPVDEFSIFFEEAEKLDQYWVAKAKLCFTEEMLAHMSSREITKTALASRLGVDPAQITRLCSGRNNFTIETMVKIARALNCEFHSHLRQKDAETFWIDVLKDTSIHEADSGWAGEIKRFKSVTEENVEEKNLYVAPAA